VRELARIRLSLLTPSSLQIKAWRNLTSFITQNRWSHPLLLLLWMAIGLGLRFTHLAAKPPWTDEFATLVFSLGHSFETVPLDQPIDVTTLLHPLQLQPVASAEEVVQHLLREDVHPPLYFVLAYWWMRLWSPTEGLLSIWVARSLPALFGVLSIPAVFGVGWLAFRSRLVAQLAAAMMAVSPFAVFLAQEARHYTLATLCVTALLACFVVAAQHIHARKTLPIWICLLWLGLTSVAIATHYFVLLTLLAIAIVLLGLGILQTQRHSNAMLRSHWRRIYAVALGTVMVGIVWLPIWQTIQDREITQWIQSGDRVSLSAIISPIAQAAAAWITMLALLPVEAKALSVVLFFGGLMILYFIWVVPMLWKGLTQQMADARNRLAITVLGGFVVGAIALFFLITYGLGSDLTRGARYNFVYFPAVIVLIGASLATLWQIHTPHMNGKAVVIVIWCVGLMSGLTVINNLGYQKYYRPELLLDFIQSESQRPVLIATTQTTLVQIGEMMGIGWEDQRRVLNHLPAVRPQFLLAHEYQSQCQDTCSSTDALYRTVANLTTQTDVWLVNFHAPSRLEAHGCAASDRPSPYISGYSAKLYHCP
jgi:uncharacterized membrane protein